MRVVFLGTPEFSVATLDAIYKSEFDLIAVISQPDRLQDRGRKLVFSPVKNYALEHNIPLLQYEKISRDGVDAIKALDPDIMVTASFGQILSQEIIDIPKFGIINVHASLLPEFRGASPIQTAIIKGCDKTGITIMRTDAGLDTGDIILQTQTDIGENETYGELQNRLALIGAELLLKALRQIKDGTATYTKQAHVDATVTKRIEKEEGRIVWQKSAEQLKCQILGQNPSPTSFSIINGVVCKIHRAKIATNVEESYSAPGTIVEPTSVKNGLFVQCGKGVLQITELQFPGGKVLQAGDAINGRKIKLGDKFEYMHNNIDEPPAKMLDIKGNIKELTKREENKSE